MRRLSIHLIIACLWLLAAPAVRAQFADLTTFRDALVFAGPGASFQQVGLLRAGVPVTLVERNRAGTWVRAVRSGLEGWIIAGYLNWSEGAVIGDLPVTDLPDGDPSRAEFASLRPLYGAPLIRLGERYRTIYLDGQALGLRPDAITKIGDSLSADPLFLEPLARPDATDHLGIYQHLADAIRVFGPSAGPSAAARVGMTSYVVFDPMWADSALCQPGETPLDCELRRTQPTIAFILFGPNDVMRMTADQFAVQLRLIVDAVLANGTIPVLSTFSYAQDAPLWWQSVDFNQRIIALADEADLPLINLWLAARTLPDYGLDVDRVHLLQTGFEYLTFEQNAVAFRGAALRNLLTVTMLDAIDTGLAAL